MARENIKKKKIYMIKCPVVISGIMLMCDQNKTVTKLFIKNEIRIVTNYISISSVIMTVIGDHRCLVAYIQF